MIACGRHEALLPRWGGGFSHHCPSHSPGTHQFQGTPAFRSPGATLATVGVTPALPGSASWGQADCQEARYARTQDSAPGAR
jgi:hypothetical protein